MRKKILLFIKKKILFLFFTVLLLEIGLRIFGFGVFELPEFSMKSNPTRHITPNKTLGIQLNPGTFEVVINKKLKYRATHLKNGQRTCGDQENINSNRPIVAFYGCSFTYGTGVNDWETYPFLVQKEFSNLIIENHAVPGYGQIQVLLSLEDDLKKEKKPDVIILNYLSFHNERNSLNNDYRKKLRIGFHATMREDNKILQFDCKYPFGVIEQNLLKIRFSPISDITSTFPLINYSATMNALQTINDRSSIDEMSDEKITLAIIDEIYEICYKYKVKLIVSTMTKDDITKRLIAHCKLKSIPTCDITVDLSKKGFTNTPYDQHPSAKAHEIYAYNLKDYMTKIK